MVTGRPLEGASTAVVLSRPPTGRDVNRYQSFSLLIQPIATRFELDEMCNLWDRDVTVYFDLHIGGSLLQPYVQSDSGGQVRSLNREVQFL